MKQIKILMFSGALLFTSGVFAQIKKPAPPPPPPPEIAREKPFPPQPPPSSIKNGHPWTRNGQTVWVAKPPKPVKAAKPPKPAPPPLPPPKVTIQD